MVQLLTNLLPHKPPADLILAWEKVDGTHPASILNAAESVEYNEYKSPGRQKEYLATRNLVRDIVSHMQLDARKFSLQKDSLGKPSGHYRGQNFKMSIAHTTERVICGIAADIELGVDIEPVNRSVPERLRNRLVNTNEASLVNNEETIRLWTVKEALVKLKGTGLRTNLNECTITDFQDGIFYATYDNDNRAKICSFVHDNHWLAIAWNINQL